MKAFVIMPFLPELDPIYHKVVIPTCSELGIQVKRADQILEPGSIPEQIYQSIRDSLFVIAEISRQNDNVFYELGYAHALDKKAILISDRSRLLPFDVRVTRTIIYDRQYAHWIEDLIQSLASAINHLYDLSERLSLDNLQSGQELEGHMHTVSGRILDLDIGQHLWFFTRREGLDTWWPQDDGELRLQRDGSWTGQLWLGREDREVDINQYYDIKFGLIDTADSRELTELTVNSKFTERFVGIRDLPASFEELAHLKVKRAGK